MFFPHCCETYAPLCWVSFLQGLRPISSNIFETRPWWWFQGQNTQLRIISLIITRKMQHLLHRTHGGTISSWKNLISKKRLSDICRYPHPNSSYPLSNIPCQSIFCTFSTGKACTCENIDLRYIASWIPPSSCWWFQPIFIKHRYP